MAIFVILFFTTTTFLTQEKRAKGKLWRSDTTTAVFSVTFWCAINWKLRLNHPSIAMDRQPGLAFLRKTDLCSAANRLECVWNPERERERHKHTNTHSHTHRDLLCTPQSQSQSHSAEHTHTDKKKKKSCGSVDFPHKRKEKNTNCGSLPLSFFLSFFWLTCVGCVGADILLFCPKLWALPFYTCFRFVTWCLWPSDNF